MTLETREETSLAELECKDASLVGKATDHSGYFGRREVETLVKRILLEDAFRKDEWVTHEGMPITNLELLIRELMEHRSWNAKVAVLELGIGKAPLVQQVEGGVEVIFKVEHDDSWIEAVPEEDESDGT